MGSRLPAREYPKVGQRKDRDDKIREKRVRAVGDEEETGENILVEDQAANKTKHPPTKQSTPKQLLPK